MKQPQLILFDLMNTLMSVHEGDVPYWYPMGKIVEANGVESADSFNERYGNWRAERYTADIIHEVTLQDRLTSLIPQAGKVLIDELASTYMNDYVQRTSPCEGSSEMLEAWDGIVPMGVVSNFFVAVMPRFILDRHGLSNHFSFIIDSVLIGYRKPSKEIYQHALDLSSEYIDIEDQSKVIMIGDDWEADVEGARNMGFHPIYYSQDPIPEEDVCVIRHWDEFRPLMNTTE